VSNEFLPPINKEKLDKLKLSKGNHIKLMKEGFVQVDDKLIIKSDLEEAIPRKCAMLVLDTPNEIILN
jgi:hypothetical protein